MLSTLVPPGLGSKFRGVLLCQTALPMVAGELYFLSRVRPCLARAPGLGLMLLVLVEEVRSVSLVLVACSVRLVSLTRTLRKAEGLEEVFWLLSRPVLHRSCRPSLSQTLPCPKTQGPPGVDWLSHFKTSSSRWKAQTCHPHYR